MTASVRIEGLRDLDRSLGQLPKATARAAGRRVLKKAGQPIIDHFRSIAPRSTESEKHMADSGGVGTRLSRRQSRLHRKNDHRDFAEMFVGPGPDPAAVMQEFGNVNHPAQPSLTPAWEAEKRNALVIITKELGGEIIKTARRLAKRAAKKAALR